MIPILLFVIFVLVDLVLAMFSVVDHQNRLYANVVFAGVSALLAAYLASAISSVIVYDEIGGVVHVITSPSAGNFLNLFSTVMWVYTIIMVYEVINEAFEKKDLERKAQEEEGP